MMGSAFSLYRRIFLSDKIIPYFTTNFILIATIVLKKTAFSSYFCDVDNFVWENN